MIFLDYIVLLSNGLLVCVLLLYIPYINNMQNWVRNLLLLLMLVFVLFVPIFKGTSTVMLIRGVAGDMSITTSITVLILLVTNLSRKKIMHPIDKYSCSIVSVLGILLYVSAFGFVSFDLYSYGYLMDLKWIALIVYFILQIVLWYFNRTFAIIWLIAIIAYIFKLQNSNNLWDYLFDPVLWLTMSLYTIKNILKWNIIK